MSTELILTLIITVVLTTLIVWGAHWIKKNKEKHPELYRHRGTIAAVIYIILNSGDFR